jgi:hypothetical protein
MGSIATAGQSAYPWIYGIPTKQPTQKSAARLLQGRGTSEPRQQGSYWRGSVYGAVEQHVPR